MFFSQSTYRVLCLLCLCLPFALNLIHSIPYIYRRYFRIQVVLNAEKTRISEIRDQQKNYEAELSALRELHRSETTKMVSVQCDMDIANINNAVIKRLSGV